MNMILKQHFVFIFFILMSTRAYAALNCSEVFQSRLSATHVNKVNLNSFKDTLPIILAYLRQIGYKQKDIALRVFDGDRVPLALQSGSDRDTKSQLFNFPIADASAEVRKKNNVSNEQVIYAHTLDITSNPLVTRPLNANEQNFKFPPTKFESILMENEPFIQAGQLTSGIAVYDTAKAIRASEVEYWLPKNRIDALIMVIHIQKDPVNP